MPRSSRCSVSGAYDPYVRAVQYGEYGDPDVLRVAETDEPHAGPGQIRIAVRAASVNAIDWKERSGMLAEMMPVALPHTPGYDAAGVVDEVGDGVEGVSVGDQVFGFTAGSSGGYAEYALLNRWAAKPPELSFEEAAGYPVAVETSARVLDLLGDGETVVINGAAGGVGTAAVQLARERGLRVIGTATESNHEYLRSLGAEPTTYGDGLAERVRELGGADLAFDAVGFGALPALIEITGSPGKVVTIADYTAPEHGVRVSGGGGAGDYALPEAAKLAAAGRFRLPVARTFPFAEAAEAHRISQEGHVRGKLALVP
jgi:NADPH:quinone reductase-like Zn-dependent oxidoreductase